MFNNPHLFQHFDRQPNVVIVVYEHAHEEPTVQAYHKLTVMDVYVVHGTTYLELKLFATSDATEPTKVVTIIDPRRWELVAQADPEHVR